MAKKKNSRSGRQAQNKSNHSESAMEGLTGKFEEATDVVNQAVNRIPRSAVYWGLGAIAVGAAAVGAYIYRDRIVEMYETAAESFESDDTDSELSSSEIGSSRSSSSTSADLSELERH